MKIRKHRLCLIILLLSALFAPIAPQAIAQHQGKEGHRFSPEEFRQKIDAFITEQAKLTPQESQKLLPLYHAMKDAQRKLMHERDGIVRSAAKGELTDKQAQKGLERIYAIDVQVVKLESEYGSKMLKVVSANKLLSVLAAEKRFERRMLHKMANPPKGTKN